MKHGLLPGLVLGALTLAAATRADDWTRFRGGDATGASRETKLPLEWSANKNIVWRTKLPGPGTSSPILTSNKIFLTCYSGYGTEADDGKMADLRLHVVCVNRKGGKILWQKSLEPRLPETRYGGFQELHGYSSSTPTTDGKRLYVFFGKSGVSCFDLDGKQLWQTSVGTGKHDWGTGTSPILYKDLLIVNASVESESLVALNKKTGKKVWSYDNITESWSTPVLVKTPKGQTELVVSGSQQILGFAPDTGKRLWNARVFDWYACPTVLPHKGVVYALQRDASTAVKVGGRGDVTDSHVVWHKRYKANVPSMVYRAGHLYWAWRGNAHCLKAATGELVYRKALTPRPREEFYASPLLADGKVYYVSRTSGTYVVAAEPKFKQLAHNTFDNDRSRTNASPIVDGGCLILRNDAYIYCIGKK